MEKTSDARKKVWQEWKNYVDTLRVHTYLDDKDFQTIARIATIFATQVQKGNKGRPVGAETVRAALRGINKTIALKTGKQPLHQIDGDHYIKTIQNIMAGFKTFDPSVEKNLAVHPDLPKFAAAYRKNREQESTERRRDT